MLELNHFKQIQALTKKVEHLLIKKNLYNKFKEYIHTHKVKFYKNK